MTIDGEGTKRLRRTGQYSGLGEKHLHAEHGDDGADERDDQRLNVAESPALQQQDQQHVEAGDEHAVKERNVEEQIRARWPSR